MSIITDTSTPAPLFPARAWSLFRSLTSGTLTPGLAWKNPAYRRKFLLRSLSTPLSTARYLKRLTHLPQLEQILHVQPGLPCRLHRPWLSINLRRNEAADALCWHYEKIIRQLPASVVNGYLSKTGAELATLSGKDEHTFSLLLRANPMQDKEGEATLLVSDAQQTVLAELTFTLCQMYGKNTLYIGGLQGAKARVPHERIQCATKACHGLFPKRLLVEAAMTLAQNLDVKEIRAVSNETHIYRSVRYRRKKEGQLHADYNSFWASLGAMTDNRGDFILPLAMPRKSMEEIASKKRAEYRRRYELLDSLHRQTVSHCQR